MIEKETKSVASERAIQSRVEKELAQIAALLPWRMTRIEDYGCFGFDTEGKYGLAHAEYGLLLAMCGGGWYRAEPGMSLAYWERDSNMGSGSKGRAEIFVNANANRDDVNRAFKEVKDRTGLNPNSRASRTNQPSPPALPEMPELRLPPH